MHTNIKGGISHFPPKFEHICSCHNFPPPPPPPPFFCADTFITSLLLIVCALRSYVKCLYRHLFLEDTSKHVRVTQKMAPPKLQHV